MEIKSLNEHKKRNLKSKEHKNLTKLKHIEIGKEEEIFIPWRSQMDHPNTHRPELRPCRRRLWC